MVVLKIIGVVYAIIVAILSLYALAVLAGIALLLIRNEETEDINNKKSE